MSCCFFKRKKKYCEIEFDDIQENPREKFLKYATASLVATAPCVGLTIFACSVFPPLVVAFIVIGSIVGAGFLINSIRLFCKGYAADDEAMIAKSLRRN